MPKVFRTMVIQDGKPMLGPSKKMLGVKTDGTSPDITPDAENFVEPGEKGMSVSPSFETLPAHFVPKKFAKHRLGAAGNDVKVRCWSMGQGAFESSEINGDLSLFVDMPGVHGNVVPIHRILLTGFQLNLAATQDQWNIDEPEVEQ